MPLHQFTVGNICCQGCVTNGSKTPILLASHSHFIKPLEMIEWEKHWMPYIMKNALDCTGKSSSNKLIF